MTIREPTTPNRKFLVKGKKGYKSYPITKNVDEKGNTLTYTVHTGDVDVEFNTLKEARLIALII